MNCDLKRLSRTRLLRLAGGKPSAALSAVLLVLGVCTTTLSAGDFHGHGGPVMAIEVSEDGRTALTGSFDYSMIYWRLDGEEPEIALRFDAHDAAVNDVTYIPASRLAASASDDGLVRIWDLETSALVHRLEGHTHKVVDLAVSPDGTRVASAAWDRTIRLWDVADGAAAGVLEGHSNNVNAVEFSLDGARLYSGGYDGTIRMWDAASAQHLRIILNFGWGINVVRVLSGGDRLLFGALDGTVAIVDIDSGDIVETLALHDGPVLSALVARDDGRAASGGGDGRIHVWDTSDWSQLRDHDNPYGPVWAMAVSGDGSSLYYGSLDDFVIQWEMIPGQPYDHVSGNFPRRFQVTADMSLGERQFARKCSICHTLTPEGANRAGPTLYQVFGRRAGTLPGYAYSQALLESDIVWTAETIEMLFNAGPQEVVPGTKMPLQRMTDPEERNALIAFLKEATAGAAISAGEDERQ
jgi:cytochrome c